MEKHLTTSPNGLNLIVNSEGVRYIPYNDGRGFATIGVGHLIRRGPTVPEDDPITHTEALELLAKDVAWAETVVNEQVRVQLTQNQFDAIVDFVFNLGGPVFTKSSVLSALNNNDFGAATASLLKYIYAGGKIEEGLVKRRAAEIALFHKVYIV